MNVWDLRQSLDPTRVQGEVKLTRDNTVVWILAPHVDWRTAGDGTDLSDRLLTPLDAAGQPITNPDVLAGRRAHRDFTWNWRQHAVEVLGGGDYAMFDNGDDRHFSGEPPYSRAVRFHVDEAAMTVQQRWSYGEDLGAETFSPIVSDVDVLPNGHVIWSPGAAWGPDGPTGVVLELDERDEVVFHARIRSTKPTYGITFHRTERLTLYP